MYICVDKETWTNTNIRQSIEKQFYFYSVSSNALAILLCNVTCFLNNSMMRSVLIICFTGKFSVGLLLDRIQTKSRGKLQVVVLKWGVWGIGRGKFTRCSEKK